jgi:predicted enzyme related to lactoylglutathione lyase
MLNLNSIMIGTSDSKKLAAFYQKVFDKKTEWEGEGMYVWKVGNTSFTVAEHSEVHGKSKEPPRIMFNFETKDVKKEFARIKKAGAEVIKEPYELGGGMIATLADPDGNYFQLVTPWED